MPIMAIMVLLACGFTSCNSKHKGFKKDDTGFYYKFHINNDTAAMPQMGDVVEMTYTMRIGDSILIPTGIYNDRIIESIYEGDIYDALRTMHVGDSATFIFEADTFFHYFQMPWSFEEKDLYVDVKLNQLIPNIEVEKMIEQRQIQDSLMREQRRIMEDSLIQGYRAINKIKTAPTESGLILTFNKKGTGEPAAIGDTVVFSYKMFSIEKQLLAENPINKPDTIELSDDIIQGLKETLCASNKGSRVTALLPSNIAFGEYGTPIIPPYTPIIMEIEVVDIFFKQK